MAELNAKLKVRNAKLRTGILSFKFMNSLALFLQIGELFEGHFNWRGVLYLGIFLLMGLTIIGFTLFAGYKTFRSKPNKKNNV